ncbi:hypothetical protein A3I55_04935 [Candidatus Woesebacteria bacterium RIFCSPLOWO2_02_FULL_42_10]|nr:MAG: hypothetical protein A3I55_04935 [Candidatus Woesebacteria bacterium RIFCSPLOWO2_02_FULL_42_10]
MNRDSLILKLSIILTTAGIFALGRAHDLSLDQRIEAFGNLERAANVLHLTDIPGLTDNIESQRARLQDEVNRSRLIMTGVEGAAYLIVAGSALEPLGRRMIKRFRKGAERD